MPSVSKKQHNFMAAVAKNPAFAKKVGISPTVGEDFLKADKGRKFAKGGHMAKGKLFGGKETYAEELKEAKAIKSGKLTPAQYAKGEKSEGVHGMKKGGVTKKMPSAKAMGSLGMKAGGYAAGGLASGHKSADGIASKGKTRGKEVAMKKGGMAKGKRGC